MKFSVKNRADWKTKAQNTNFDLVIIGGGITGAGILLDAITRGLSAILIEKEDFAFGTSSRSTKLIHGGLRYLKNLEFALVRETGLERANIYKNAAHIVRPENMLLPIFTDGSLGKWTTSFGLMIYDNLAGVEKSEKRQMYSAEKVLELEPLVKSEKLTSGGLYKEYRTDDARLVIETIKKAVQYGALALNYCACTSFTYDENGKVNGCFAKDEIDESTFEIKGKTVINATGPWADNLIDEDSKRENETKKLMLTKGVHLVFDFEDLPLKQSVYFDSPDGRMIFAIPKNGITYVGTTDTFYNGDISKPKVTEEDVNYLIAAIGFMFPMIKLSKENVISSWVGLRPLISEEGKKPSELSRKDEIFVSKSNLISIAGGKLTGYRKMAKRVVNQAFEQLMEKDENLKYDYCITKQIKLSGGDFANPNDVSLLLLELQDQFGELINKALIKDLVYKYGTNTVKILSNIKEGFTEKDLLINELKYAIENEAVSNISDFLIRRTSMLYFQPKKAMENVALLQSYLENNEGLNTNHLNKYKAVFLEEMNAASKF